MAAFVAKQMIGNKMSAVKGKLFILLRINLDQYLNVCLILESMKG